jgi:hypothetical protein
MKSLIRVVAALCALLLLAEPLVHKHGEFRFEEWFGFHGFFGLAAGAVLVLAAIVLRGLLARPGNYYERD